MQHAINLLVEITHEENDGMACQACSCHYTSSSKIRKLGSAIGCCSSESGKMVMQIEKYSSSIDLGDSSNPSPFFLYVTRSISFCKESLASVWKERATEMLF